MNPSAILSALITPAVLIAACGPLILSTSQRTNNVVNQLRAWSHEFAELSGETDAWHASRRALLHDLIGLSSQRARLLQHALMGFIVAVGFFVATGAAVGVSALLAELGIGWGWYLWPPVILGLAGSASLLTGCVFLITEARLAVAHTAEETRFAMSWRARVAEESPLPFEDDDEERIYSPRAARSGIGEQVLGAVSWPWRGGRRQ